MMSLTSALIIVIILIIVYMLYANGYIKFAALDSFSNRLWTPAERSFYTGESVGLIKMPIINNYKQMANVRGVFGVPHKTFETKDPRVISSMYKSGLGDPETLIPPANFD